MMPRLTAILCGLCLVLGTAVSALAGDSGFDLQITEIWPGNDPGDNLTADWFEITNFGDTAWTPAAGDLYFDDDSSDASTADIISGISSIGPGESVIALDDTDTAEFEAVWATAILPQIGLYDGSGLGQGGDAVTLFLSTGPPTGAENIIDLASFPTAESNGGQSYDTVLGEFSSLANGAVQSAIANDMGQYAFGSPGPPVPEPTSIVLILLGATLAALFRRN